MELSLMSRNLPMTFNPFFYFFCFFYILIWFKILACVVGYLELNCSLPCRYPNYGLGRQLNCNCDKENCNIITGCQKSRIASSTKTCIYIHLRIKHICLFYSILYGDIIDTTFRLNKKEIKK